MTAIAAILLLNLALKHGEVLLLRIGLIRLSNDGSVQWPVSVRPWWIWKVQIKGFLTRDRSNVNSPFGVFRNLPHVIKWQHGRLLPRRWGFHIFGLEIGDRG